MNLGDNGFQAGPVERMSDPESRCCPQPLQATSGIKVTVERNSQIRTYSPIPVHLALNSSELKNLMNLLLVGFKLEFKRFAIGNGDSCSSETLGPKYHLHVVRSQRKPLFTE
jgi:hypothetical protein